MARTTLSGAHTAGIYADLTLDGPEIGTLVVIFDRAKNLPNRKTMGKQNPYCAARLGKEAKKTETDKRGGQTPKWFGINLHNRATILTCFRDQELRFTVHDSPDYYQLKVSVFNDDKKTELIGETWVALDHIVVPGGGTNDLWHSLNCKGRYAGDIRIELTYYDTRPKLEKAEDRRQSAPVVGSMDQVGGGIGGPRQPKPVKRRPLPADPTDPSRSSPLPHTPPPTSQNLSGSQQRYVESPDDYGFRSTPPTDMRHQRLQDEQPRSSPLAINSQPQRPYNDGMNTTPTPDQPILDMYDPTAQTDYRQVSAPMLTQSPQNGRYYNQECETDPDYMDDWQVRPLAQPLQNGMIHANSSPAMIDPRLRQSTMPPAWPNAEFVMGDEGLPPPPPPAHRSMPLTPPLSTRARGNATGSITGSPLAKVQSNSSFQGYQPSISPSNAQFYLHQDIPPSLVPGHEPTTAEDESEMMYERRTNARQQSHDQPVPQARSPSSVAPSRQQPLPRSFENMQERRAHRYSAPVDRYSTPINRPRAISPDSRTPARKSVSPHPVPAERHQQSAVPFSPDSFEAYNPSLSAANSVNDIGARYSTPEQAKEASRQHERQEKFGDGPIIGNNGRIIDPSDHLPTDTWAPEPEQKIPTRRTPEVSVRFRNSPQGAQPMPSAGRRPLNEARTQSASTLMYAHHAGNSPSNLPNRNHLQQYPRISPGNIPPPVPGKVPIGGGKEDWGDALSEEMRRIDIGSGRRRGYGP